MRLLNRKVRRNYHIIQTLEAGVVLSGSEVKSLRANRADINDAFVKIQGKEAILKNTYIYPYQGEQAQGYDPRHDRKLLLHKDEISSFIGKLSGSVTLIPLSIYSKRNFIKVELGLAASKKKYDKRRAIKEKDETRKLEQELRSDKLEYQNREK